MLCNTGLVGRTQLPPISRWFSVSLGDSTPTLSDRMLSTYVNPLSKAGFVIGQMFEESDDEILQRNDGEFARRAGMFPVTLAIKARKL